MAENERPWNYELTGHLQPDALTDEELEVLADRLVPARISIQYWPAEGHLAFRGWTFSTPVWDHFTYIKNTVHNALPHLDVVWAEAYFAPGETEEEAKAELERMLPGWAA